MWRVPAAAGETAVEPMNTAVGATVTGGLLGCANGTAVGRDIDYTIVVSRGRMEVIWLRSRLRFRVVGGLGGGFGRTVRGGTGLASLPVGSSGCKGRGAVRDVDVTGDEGATVVKRGGIGSKEGAKEREGGNGKLHGGRKGRAE